MKKKNHPFVSCIISQGATGMCHCGKRGEYTAQNWYDLGYRDELASQGINDEYAALLTVRHSIKLQRKQDSKPISIVSLCHEHAISSIDTYMGKKIAVMELLMFALDPLSTIFLLDRNESEDAHYPTLARYQGDNIHSFLEMYESDLPALRIQL